jgi:hypothetical protein
VTERGKAPSERAADVARANNSYIHLCSFSQIIVGDKRGEVQRKKSVGNA